MEVKKNVILNRFLPFIDFLHEVLGKPAELILYDMQEEPGYIFYIKTTLSAKKIGDLMDKNMQNQLDKMANDVSFITNFRATSENDKVYRSSVFFLRDQKNKTVGLCQISIDISSLNGLKRQLEDNIDLLTSMLFPTDWFKEIDQENIDEHSNKPNLLFEIREAVYKVTGIFISDNVKLKKQQKLAIVTYLYDKNFFEIKGSIGKLAQVFSVSEGSVYKYIQEVRRISDREN